MVFAVECGSVGPKILADALCYREVMIYDDEMAVMIM